MRKASLGKDIQKLPSQNETRRFIAPLSIVKFTLHTLFRIASHFTRTVDRIMKISLVMICWHSCKHKCAIKRVLNTLELELEVQRISVTRIWWSLNILFTARLSNIKIRLLFSIKILLSFLPPKTFRWLLQSSGKSSSSSKNDLIKQETRHCWCNRVIWSKKKGNGCTCRRDGEGNLESLLSFTCETVSVSSFYLHFLPRLKWKRRDTVRHWAVRVGI